MALKVGINGFGRIGRLVVRAGINNPNLEFAAINDLKNPQVLAYLLRWDSTHGLFQGKIEERVDGIVVKDRFIPFISVSDPKQLHWDKYGVDYVLESTGMFKDSKNASHQLKEGVKRVIISAPTKDPNVPTLLFGINHEFFNPETKVVSMAGCTTNCLAPIAKVIHETFGLAEGIMTTIHAYTATQALVDGASDSPDWARNRDAAQNLVPTSASAATTVGLVLPELKGKLTGTAIRVPVTDVSLIDFTFRTEKDTSYLEICEAIRRAALGELEGILGCIEEPLVSRDFLGDPRSSIFDVGRGIQLNSRFFKVFAWYDNEWGYSKRIIDLMEWMAHKEGLL